MEEYFRAATGDENVIREVHLDRNGLKDKGLANLLRGIAKGDDNNVTKLAIFNNEMGPETLVVLKKYYLEDIKSLSLGNVKMDSNIKA